MTLFEFRKKHLLTTEELSSMLGLSVSYLRNHGKTDIKDLSRQTQQSLNLLEEILSLKKIIEAQKEVIKILSKE